MVKWGQNCFFGKNSLCKVRVVFLGELLLEKTIFSVRQKGVPPLLLPTSVLQLPRCLVRICNLLHKSNQIANGTVSKNAIAAGKTCCKYNLLRKRGLLAHTSAAFLKNCCTEKLFICASHKPFTLLFPNRYAIMKQISERSICLCIAYSSPSLP